MKKKEKLKRVPSLNSKGVPKLDSETIKISLTLKKETITQFNPNPMGRLGDESSNTNCPGWSGGCTDGCTSLFASAYNCTKTTCTADCDNECSNDCRTD